MSKVIDKTMNDAWLAGGRKAHKLELIRLHRNHLLKRTDEYALGDRTLSAEMKTFRENLFVKFLKRDLYYIKEYSTGLYNNIINFQERLAPALGHVT